MKEEIRTKVNLNIFIFKRIIILCQDKYINIINITYISWHFIIIDLLFTNKFLNIIDL